MSGDRVSSSHIRQVQRKLRSVVKNLKEHPDIQDVFDVLEQHQQKRRRGKKKHPLTFLSNLEEIDHYKDNYKSFVKDVENSFGQCAKIKGIEPQDMSILKFFYQSIFYLFSDSMSEDDRRNYSGKMLDENDSNESSQLEQIREPGFSKLLIAIKKDKRAKLFLYPVDVSAAPGYLDVVKKPMDLSTVSKNLEEGKYDYASSGGAAAKKKAVGAFAADMRLIWTNCMAYNAPGSEIYESSEALGEFFEKMLNSAFKGLVVSSRSSDKSKFNEDTVRDTRYEKILIEMKSDPRARPFLHPVDVKTAPGYLDVVSRPMDLSTLKDRLDSGRYDYMANASVGGKSKMVNLFANDMRLIWNNCMAYNAPGSDIYESSKSLGRTFEKVFESYFRVGFPESAIGNSTKSTREPGFSKLLTAIKKDKRAKLFLYPVDVSAAPGYLDVVKKPMDLSTVSKNLEEGKYDYASSGGAAAKKKAVGAFAADMRLIWTNCMAYNAPGSEIYESSEALGEFFEKMLNTTFSGGGDAEALKCATASNSKSSALVSPQSIAGSTREPGFSKLLTAIKKDKRAKLFLYPVDVSAAPGYLDVVKKPMDLSTVSKNLEEGKYDYAPSGGAAAKKKAVGAFAADMRLIWTNCMAYNAPGSEIYESSEALGEFFEKMLNTTFSGGGDAEALKCATASNSKSSALVSPQSIAGSTREPGFSKLLTAIKKDKRAKLFLYPVDVSAAPGYLDVVKKPMDLSTVSKNLEEGKYDYASSGGAAAKKKAVGAFAADMRLIWTNCMAYNAPGSEIYESSEALGEFFEKMLNTTFSGGGDAEALKCATASNSKSSALVSPQSMAGSTREPGFSKLLTAIKKDKRAKLFLYPVDVSAAPGYLDVVKKPMDLSTVSKNLEEGKYDYASSGGAAAKKKAVGAFAADMRLIWTNCMAYNAPGSEIYESSKALGNDFEQQFKLLLGNATTVRETHSIKPIKKKERVSSTPSNGVDGVSNNRFKNHILMASISETTSTAKHKTSREKGEAKLKFSCTSEVDNKELEKIKAFMSNLVSHPLSYPFMESVNEEDDEDIFPPKNLRAIQNNLSYYCKKDSLRIDEYMEHILGVLDFVNIMASKKGLKCTKSFDYELYARANPDLSLMPASPGLQLCIDTPTFYALIVNKFQMDYYPTITFKVWKEKKRVYLPLTVQIKLESLDKKTSRNELARAALLKVRDDIKIEDDGGGSQFSVFPQVEEDLFYMSRQEFDDVLHKVNPDGEDSSRDSSCDPQSCDLIRHCASRYAQAGLKHWISKFSGTFHEREGLFSEIKYADKMYRVIDFGKIVGKQSFPCWNDTDNLRKSRYIFPLGYKCVRTIILCLVPRGEISSPNWTIQSPDSYSHIEVEFLNEVISLKGDSSDDPYVLRISVGNGVIVTECPLNSPDDCRDAWAICTDASMGPKIMKALGAPLRRCRAVLNRLCTLPFIMPFMEQIPMTNSPTSLDYYSATPAPMWLREVHDRLVEGIYEYVTDFAWDVRLVFSNCFNYNVPDSPLYDAAANALQFFEVLFCEWVINVKDNSVSDLATGPWDMWMHLKYFDGHTLTTPSVPREIISPKRRSTGRYRDQDIESKRNENHCCITNAVGTLRSPLLFCEYCEDSYHPGIPEAQEGAMRENLWLCRRCVNSPDWQDAVRNPKLLRNSKLDAKTDAEVASRDEDFVPSAEFGPGWFSRQDKQLFLSPSGYYLSNIVEVHRHVFDEYEMHQELIDSRKNEFQEEKGRPGTASKSKKKKKSKEKSQPQNKFTSKLMTSGKLANIDDFEVYDYVWMGLLSEVESQEQAYLPLPKARKAEAQLAIRHFRLTSSSTVSSPLSNWGNDPDRKIYLAALNIDDNKRGSFLSSSKRMLTTAGLTGLDDPVIHLCCEGLDNVEPLLMSLSGASDDTFSYEYTLSYEILSAMKVHILKVKERRAAMIKAESAIRSIVSSEKVAISRQLKEEADMIVGLNRDPADLGEDSEYASQSEEYIRPLLPSKMSIESSEYLFLLETWEFLSSIHGLVGNHAMGLADLVKSTEGVDTSDNHDDICPNISTVFFDELGCNFTAVLLDHIKDSVVFPGIKSLLRGATTGPEDPEVFSSQLTGFATASALSLGDGLYFSDESLPRPLQQLLTFKQKKLYLSVNEKLEGIWQDILLVNPLNALTWPVIAHRALTVLSYVQAVEQQQTKQDSLMKGSLFAMQLFNRRSIFEKNHFSGRECILDMWIILLCHPNSGSFWNRPIESDNSSHKIEGLSQIEQILVAGIGLNSLNVNTEKRYLKISSFVDDVKSVFQVHSTSQSTSSDIAEDMAKWFDSVSHSFCSAEATFPLKESGSYKELADPLCFVDHLISALQCLTRTEPERLAKTSRLSILKTCLWFGVQCQEYRDVVKRKKALDASMMNAITGVGKEDVSVSKKMQNSSHVVLSYPELYPILLSPAPHKLSKAALQSPQLQQYMENWQSVAVRTGTGSRKSSSRDPDLTVVSNPVCYFTGLEPKHIPGGGDWIVVPDELLSAKSTSVVSSSTIDNSSSDSVSNRPNRDKRKSSSSNKTSMQPSVCLRAVAAKIASVRKSVETSSSDSLKEENKLETPPLAGTLSYFYPPSDTESEFDFDFWYDISPEMSHVQHVLHTYPLGFDRLGRQYFFIDAQKLNLISGYNLYNPDADLIEPGLIVFSKSSWSFIAIDSVLAFANSLLNDKFACEKFLRQRIQREFPCVRKTLSQKVGVVLANEGHWFRPYDDVEQLLSTLRSDLKLKSESDNAEVHQKLMRELESSFTHAVDTRLTVHSGIICNDLEDDNHEYAYKGLAGVDWSSMSAKETKRLSELKRRHKRSKMLEMSLDFHPQKGWLRQIESFERLRQLGAITLATRIHSEPHILDHIRSHSRRSRFVSCARFGYGASLTGKKRPNSDSASDENANPPSLSRMVPSTVFCHHRMLKLKAELLNVVAILPQNMLNFRIVRESADSTESIASTEEADQPDFSSQSSDPGQKRDRSENNENRVVRPRVSSPEAKSCDFKSVEVPDYIRLVQSCDSYFELCHLIAVLEDACGVQMVNPEYLLSRENCITGRQGIAACHSALQLYSLDRCLKYEEIDGLNCSTTSINKATSNVNYRPKVDFVPKCISNPYCLRPLCHYHKCVLHNAGRRSSQRYGMSVASGEASATVESGQRGFNTESVRMPAGQAIVERFGASQHPNGVSSSREEVVQTAVVAQPFVPTADDVSQSMWI